MTDQEIFDEVVTHVIKQGEQAFEYQSCVYLTEDGLSCAVGGPLVARGLYTPYIVGATMYQLRNGDRTTAARALEAALDAWGVLPGQYLLLQDLQQAHDGAQEPFITEFRSKARRIATLHSLNTLVLDMGATKVRVAG